MFYVVLILALAIVNIAITATIIRKKSARLELILNIVLFNLAVTVWQASLILAMFLTNLDLVPKMSFASASWAVVGALGISILFPNSKISNKRRLLLTIVEIVNAIITIGIATTDLFVAGYEPETSVVAFGQLGTVMLIFLLVVTLLVIYMFVSRYVTETRVRFYFRYLFLSFATYGILGLIFNLALPLLGITQFTVIGSLAAIVPQIGIAYTLIASPLYASKYLIGRIWYTLIRAFIYYALFYVIAMLYRLIFGDIFATQAYVIGAFIAIGVTLFFIPLEKQIQDYFEEKVLYGKYSPIKTQAELSKITSSELNLPKLTQNIVNLLSRYIETNKVAIVINDKEAGKVILEKSDGYNTDDFIQQDHIEREFKKITGVLQNMPYSTILKQELEQGKFYQADSHGALIDFMKTYRVEIISPIKQSGETIGFYMLGAKLSPEPYTIQDIALLSTLFNTSNVAIGRSLLYSKVKSYSETLEQKVAAATAQLKDRNAELQRLYSELNDLYEKEKDLMDIAGHELRTPVSVVKTNLYMLKSRLEKDYPKAYDEKVQRYFDRLLESTEREITMVNTFLESARIDNKKFELNFSTEDFGQLVANSVEDNLDAAKKKALKVIFEQPKSKIFVDIDNVRIREVIDNLISNAIKYTNTGYVEVKVNETDKMVGASVKDSGIGIKKEDQGMLFRKFSRVKTHLGDGQNGLVRPGGTGLGLYVAKSIIDGHGGKIWVESEEGKGSTFSFELPKITRKSVPAAPTAIPAKTAISTKIETPKKQPDTEPTDNPKTTKPKNPEKFLLDRLS